MDRAQYPIIMHNILHRLGEWYAHSPQAGIETEIVADDRNGNYMLLDIGWTDEERVKRQFVYVRLKDGKFWIEEDWTEEGIVSYLQQASVPNEDIVLAFNPPDLRQYTEFAVA